MIRRLLTVDVGNTATSAALFDAGRSGSRPSPKAVWTISTDRLFAQRAFLRFLKPKLPSRSGGLDAIVSSVVPSVDRGLRRDLLSLAGTAAFVDASFPSKIKVRYRDPAEVGADRLVNARGALAYGPGAKIVIDFGTATTFDCVSARNEYLGGVICPGPVISAEALYRRTAKLPLVVLDRPARILGRNTLESIQAGLYHGYRGLVREIVRNLKRQLGQGTTVLATGGQAKWILKGLGVVDRHVPHLTHLGLFLLWKDFKNER